MDWIITASVIMVAGLVAYAVYVIASNVEGSHD